MATSIVIDRSSAIYVISLSRPDKLNAMTNEMKREIREALEEFEHCSEYKVAVICGVGRAFSTGADRKELDDGRIFSGIGAHEILSHPKRTKPILAQVHGYCLGMALGMALECDLIIAAAKTKFQVTETVLNLDCRRYYRLLAMTAGVQFASDVCLTGRYFDAEEANKAGMLAFVSAPDELTHKTRELAEHIANFGARGIVGAVQARAEQVASINARVN